MVPVSCAFVEMYSPGWFIRSSGCKFLFPSTCIFPLHNFQMWDSRRSWAYSFELREVWWKKSPAYWRHLNSWRVRTVPLTKKRKKKVSHVMCHMLHVTCHVLPFACHLSSVRCHQRQQPRTLPQESSWNWMILLSTFVNGSIGNLNKPAKSGMTYDNALTLLLINWIGLGPIQWK